eukprot:560863-Amphidinium_carterae.1
MEELVSMQGMSLCKWASLYKRKGFGFPDLVMLEGTAIIDGKRSPDIVGHPGPRQTQLLHSFGKDVYCCQMAVHEFGSMMMCIRVWIELIGESLWLQKSKTDKNSVSEPSYVSVTTLIWARYSNASEFALSFWFVDFCGCSLRPLACPGHPVWVALPCLVSRP